MSVYDYITDLTQFDKILSILGLAVLLIFLIVVYVTERREYSTKLKAFKQTIRMFLGIIIIWLLSIIICSISMVYFQ